MHLMLAPMSGVISLSPRTSLGPIGGGVVGEGIAASRLWIRAPKGFGRGPGLAKARLRMKGSRMRK